ncbi:MAG: hypothetical protein INF88_18665 [Roseomonas sp.]|nr:hypothetical protein [Roseomonas sp.]
MFLDRASVSWSPHHWIVNQLIHKDVGTFVRHVMIGGRFVVRDGCILTNARDRRVNEAEAAWEGLEAPNA